MVAPLLFLDGDGRLLVGTADICYEMFVNRPERAGECECMRGCQSPGPHNLNLT